MGPGLIAGWWIATVQKNTRQLIVAVGSTSINRATAFANKYNVPSAYGSYDDLLADDSVDIVYVSTRQHKHRENVMQALAAGKHVLVEKPIASTAEDARAIRDAARASGKFVMEAMWTTYLPQSDVIRQVLADGVLGEIRYVEADLGQDLRDQQRLFDVNGGGTSHDVGIYPTAFVSSVFGTAPVEVNAIGDITDDGIDTALTIRTKYASGGSGYAFSTTTAFTPSGAWIDGTRGSLQVTQPFPVPTGLTLFEPKFHPQPVATWVDEAGFVAHEGLFYQVNAVAHFIRQGLTESPLRNLDVSVRDIEIIADARHQIGAFYPGER
jgi:predicted dehydrogenase